MSTLPLFPKADDPTIDERFAAFDAAAPEVYRLFVFFARQLREAGHTRYSSDALLHRVRWHFAVKGPRAGEAYKINNNFSSRYARKLMEEYPDEFAGFFECRKLRAD